MYAGAWGYRTDGDAGLMHVGARYYDAQVGRFITRDTVLSQHAHLYCEHDPVNAVDPSGHFVIKIWWFHCWIEYPGGSIGYWPGSPNPVWGPGLIQSPDPYGGTFGVPVFYFPSPVADNALTVFGRLDGDRVGVYQFPMFQCIHGAFVLAAMAVIVDHADRRKHHKGFEPSWDFPLGP